MHVGHWFRLRKKISGPLFFQKHLFAAGSVCKVLGLSKKPQKTMLKLIDGRLWKAKLLSAEKLLFFSINPSGTKYVVYCLNSEDARIKTVSGEMSQ
jgi:hypothetical protein